jgi:predicted DNA-binding transcriptional regulator AlpA
MNTQYMLFAMFEKPFLSLEETCKAIGISKQSAYNMRSQKVFPIPMLNNPLRASIEDVAKYIDQQLEEAREKMNYE